MGVAPPDAVVSIYVDLIAPVQVGHEIQTGTGRRYGVIAVRVQTRGRHVGRQYLRCLVLQANEPCTGRVHLIYWYPRGRRRAPRC